jgi:hypothetical protein
MSAPTKGTKNVTAIELARGQEIERGCEEPDPGGAADRVEEEVACVDAGMKDGCEEAQDKRNAEDDLGMSGIRESRNNSGVKNSIKERGNGQEEADERARRANVEQGARGANRGSDEDKGAKSADERGSRYEERVAGANVVMAASEEMAKLMRQKNCHERQGEWEAAQKGGGMAIEKCKGANELIDRDGLIVCVGGGKLRASGKASTQREKKERDGEKQGLEGRAGANGGIVVRL